MLRVPSPNPDPNPNHNPNPSPSPSPNGLSHPWQIEPPEQADLAWWDKFVRAKLFTGCVVHVVSMVDRLHYSRVRTNASPPIPWKNSISDLDDTRP